MAAVAFAQKIADCLTFRGKGKVRKLLEEVTEQESPLFSVSESDQVNTDLREMIGDYAKEPEHEETLLTLFGDVFSEASAGELLAALEEAEKSKEKPQELASDTPTKDSETKKRSSEVEKSLAEEESGKASDAPQEKKKTEREKGKEKSPSSETPLPPGATFNVFVGEIPDTAGKEDLAEAFKAAGKVAYSHIVYDRGSGRSKGYGFVHFEDRESQQKALALKDVQVKGRVVLISAPHEKNTIFLGNLPYDMTTRQLNEIVKKAGATSGLKSLELKEGKGFGFIEYESFQFADVAKRAISRIELRGRSITAMWAEGRKGQPRGAELDSADNKYIYVSNLPLDTTTEKVEQFVGTHFGTNSIEKVVLPRDNSNQERIRGFGFVYFTNRNLADMAVEKLNGTKFDGHTLTVEIARARKRDRDPRDDPRRDEPMSRRRRGGSPPRFMRDDPYGPPRYGDRYGERRGYSPPPRSRDPYMRDRDYRMEPRDDRYRRPRSPPRSDVYRQPEYDYQAPTAAYTVAPTYVRVAPTGGFPQQTYVPVQSSGAPTAYYTTAQSAVMPSQAQTAQVQYASSAAQYQPVEQAYYTRVEQADTAAPEVQYVAAAPPVTSSARDPRMRTGDGIDGYGVYR